MPFFAFVKIMISTLALHGNVKYFTFVINLFNSLAFLREICITLCKSHV